MRKKLLLFALCLLLVPAVCSAHSGRTDANGGHYDRSTGEYHYHHGYPAHQHINGICPYNFDDQTNSSGGSSGNSSSSSSGNSSSGFSEEISDLFSVTAVTAAENKDPYQSGYDDGYADGRSKGYDAGYDEGRDIGWNSGFQSGTEKTKNTALKILAGCAVVFILYKILRRRSKTKAQQNITSLQQQKSALDQEIEKRAQEIKEMEEILARMAAQVYVPSDTQLRLTDDSDAPASSDLIPPGVVIGPDGLPRDEYAFRHWGKTYTVYVNMKTHVYHKGSCHHVNPYSCVPTHIFIADETNIPCSVCKPQMPETKWFLDYEKAKNIYTKYK